MKFLPLNFLWKQTSFQKMGQYTSTLYAETSTYRNVPIKLTNITAYYILKLPRSNCYGEALHRMLS